MLQIQGDLVRFIKISPMYNKKIENLAQEIWDMFYWEFIYIATLTKQA